MPSALLFANGDALDGGMVRRALKHSPAPFVVAADGGALNAQTFGYMPHVIIGDMDSLTPETVHAMTRQGAELLRYPPEKDETDLELALKFCATRPYAPLYIIGALGGRLDQLLANVYLLALPELQGRDVRIVDGEQSARLLTAGEYTLTGAKGDTLSLLPVGGDVQNIHTDGLYYPLKGETLSFGPARGLSNVLLADHATLRFESGALLVVHTIGRA